MSTTIVPTPADVAAATAAGFVESQSALTWELTPVDRIHLAIAQVEARNAGLPEPTAADFAADHDRVRHIGGPADRSGRPIPPPPVLSASFGPDATSAREARRIDADERYAAAQRRVDALPARRVDTARLMAERTSCLQAG